MNNRFETFTVLINQISRNIRKIKNQEMADYNLRSSHGVIDAAFFKNSFEKQQSVFIDIIKKTTLPC